MNTIATPVRGHVRAAIFDLAGTTVDHGCRAPVGVFVEVLARHGLEVSMEEARGPMGTAKRDHLRELCAIPHVRDQWRARTGRDMTVDDEDAIYDELTELQLACLPRFADPIPGVLDVWKTLRSRGIRIATTTGYTREMLDVLLDAAVPGGFDPEVAISSSDVPAGRPAPFMLFEALRQLGVWPVRSCVAIGDTPKDMEAGRNAGMWTVGVAMTGNEVGLSRPELDSLAQDRLQLLRNRAYRHLVEAGAHYVVDSVAELPRVLDDIEARLARGERP